MQDTPTHNRTGQAGIAGNTGRGEAQSRDSDALVYRWVGLMLRAGMTVSFVAMGGGLIWWFAVQARGGGAGTAPAPGPEAWNPLALLNLGLIALLATPAVALAAGTIAFALEGNRRYAIIGALVGMILLAGLALSMR